MDVVNDLNVSKNNQTQENKTMTNTLRKRIFSTLALTLVALVVALPANADYAEKVEIDIVDVAVGAGSFETLVAALQAAGLVEALKADGPYTVFAPTDEAFAKLPAGTIEELLKPENKDQLVAILTYHVVPGKVMASQVSDGLTATTLQGDDLSFDLSSGNVMIGQAHVITTDIGASNCVIHVIDTVLLPQ